MRPTELPYCFPSYFCTYWKLRVSLIELFLPFTPRRVRGLIALDWNITVFVLLLPTGTLSMQRCCVHTPQRSSPALRAGMRTPDLPAMGWEQLQTSQPWDENSSRPPSCGIYRAPYLWLWKSALAKWDLNANCHSLSLFILVELALPVMVVNNLKWHFIHLSTALPCEQASKEL